MIIYDHLLLNVVQQLVADPVGVIDTSLYCCVPRQEVFVDIDKHTHVFVFQEEALEVLAVLILCLALLDLAANSVDHVL